MFFCSKEDRDAEDIYKPEEIVAKLRQVDVLTLAGAEHGRGDPLDWCQRGDVLPLCLWTALPSRLSGMCRRRYVLLRAVPRSDDGFVPLAVVRTQPDFNAFPHPAGLAHPQDHWNHSSAPIY
jgi:hypothetical protein